MTWYSYLSPRPGVTACASVTAKKLRGKSGSILVLVREIIKIKEKETKILRNLSGISGIYLRVFRKHQSSLPNNTTSDVDTEIKRQRYYTWIQKLRKKG
jgi:hypothetical protein